MLSPQPKAPKRPTCPTCSKPLKVCLCVYLHNTSLQNTVHVTILQHSSEQNHPLNTTRIAKLGLKNLSVVTVNKVLFDARFDIHLLAENYDVGFDDHALNCPESDKVLIFKEAQVENLEESVECDTGGEFGGVFVNGKWASSCRKGVITARMDKEGVVSSVEHPWMDDLRLKKPDLLEFLKFPMACDALTKGFVVKKFQKRKVFGSLEFEECEEYEVLVPPGSVLLFPRNEAFDIGGLKAMGYEVKNLIVLDGTWREARSIYHKNPWLKLLPHLRLNLDKTSLYGEVRRQPKAGYLSTLESIVYTLKAFGDDPGGLDNLLDVLEAMVRDQRRFKDEKLSKAS